jgi:Yip1-like protein
VPEATAPAGAAGPATAAPAPGRSFAQNVAGVLFSPREEFPHILARPRFWVPLLCWMAVGIAFTAFWLQKVDAREFMRNEIVSSGRADKIPPGQMEQVLDQRAGFFKPISWTSAFVGAPILTFVVAAMFLFVFRFFYAGELTYRQSLSVTAWTYFIVLSLVMTPLTLVVMGLKGDWNINPQEALQANPAMFLDRLTTSKPLYKLAESLDLFTFWVIWLFSAGYGVATRRTTGSAAVGVLSVWALYVLAKLAWAAIM